MVKPPTSCLTSTHSVHVACWAGAITGHTQPTILAETHTMSFACFATLHDITKRFAHTRPSATFYVTMMTAGYPTSCRALNTVCAGSGHTARAHDSENCADLQARKSSLANKHPPRCHPPHRDHWAEYNYTRAGGRNVRRLHKCNNHNQSRGGGTSALEGAVNFVDVRLPRFQLDSDLSSRVFVAPSDYSYLMARHTEGLVGFPGIDRRD